MTNTSLAERLFGIADQAAFATLSRDYNPMHMDDRIARRTQAGACVVHGIHLFLWALEELSRLGWPIKHTVEARVRFTEFVYLDQPTALRIVKADNSLLRFQLTTDTSRALTATLRFGQSRLAVSRRLEQALPLIEIDKQPREPAFESMATQRGQLKVADPRIAQRLFPTLAESVGKETVCEIALLSAIIGMITPGLHSIFSELNLTMHRSREGPAGCTFQGERADSRFRRVEVSVEGSWISAELTAFARFPPTLAPSLKEIADRVVAGEFRGRRALVIGGSRGIGAVTAKAIAAGGGDVILTYAEDRLKGESVHADISNSCGAGTSVLLQYQVGQDPSSQLASLQGTLTHVYYFATPRIFGTSLSVYNRARFLQFLDIYVDGFSELVHALLARQSPKSLTLLYPSSVAVNDRPKGMTEYSMAKAAGEVLCADLTRNFPGLAIGTPRLPRIQSDQTATVPPVPAAEPLEVMLPLLRAERA